MECNRRTAVLGDVFGAEFGADYTVVLSGGHDLLGQAQGRQKHDACERDQQQR
jgi:hypothetical protein